MPKQELTARQAEILEFIQSAIETESLPPTRQEIARHFGFHSANAAETHLRALARKGVIDLTPGASRGIRLIASARGLPLVGRVAAGSPILAAEHIEGEYRLDGDLFSARPHYLLRVQGMSMRDAGILEGDLLAVRREADIRNGQIVVARLDDEVTVKRYRQRGSDVWLLPENPDYEPIRVDMQTQSIAIEGLVVGVIRNAMPL
ncbi:MAG TPA: transcriptional repressor LexA [Gammaproteobacteria bacterium]|nr:transcriptional repressor LexA [Gammaproteobacteria bacterium]